LRALRKLKPQRKHLIGYFDDSLFRSTIPIGWRLRALRLDGNRVLRSVFDCVIFLRLLRFLRTFLTQSVALRALCALLETGLQSCVTADVNHPVVDPGQYLALPQTP